MTPHENVARVLIEAETSEKDRVFIDRMILRIFSFPSLLAFFSDAHSLSEGEVELVFRKIPNEVIPQVVKLIGVNEVKLYKFTKDGHPMLGFKIQIPEKKKSNTGWEE